jgi:hypothetical protein
MKAPTFEIYEAPEDLDFRILHVGQDVAFPFEALFVPGTNAFVDQMTADEIQALIDLNPLASNPHARIEEPRYIHVKTFASLQGALLSIPSHPDAQTHPAMAEAIDCRGLLAPRPFATAAKESRQWPEPNVW